MREKHVDILTATEIGACYIDLAIKESDNNVKSIVLQRLSELHKDHDRVLEDKVMDVLRVLSRYGCEMEGKSE